MKSETMYNALLEEVERLKKELEELEIVSKYNALEAERLKKYLEVPRLSYWYDEGKKFGLVEGERRAMQRVNQAMANACAGEGVFDKTYFYKELHRLGEEEKS